MIGVRKASALVAVWLNKKGQSIKERRDAKVRIKSGIGII